MAWLFVEFRPVVSAWFEIRTITVRGQQQVSREDVVKALPIHSGETLWSFDATRAVSDVEALPWVKEATIHRILFHTVEVSVTESEPAAIVEYPGEKVFVDEQGTVLAVVTQDHLEYPIIRGVDNARLRRGDRQARDLVQASIQVARVLTQAFGGSPLVDVGTHSNLEVFAGGQRFQFGASGFLEQWDRYRNVTLALGQKSLGGGPGADRVIDLRYPKKVIVRERG